MNFVHERQTIKAEVASATKYLGLYWKEREEL
jgi:hypothetical protein